jgi:hypothetical protein
LIASEAFASAREGETCGLFLAAVEFIIASIGEARTPAASQVFPVSLRYCILFLQA